MADLSEVLVFAAVADAGSFTAAARQLDMPRSTVSRKVSQLEEQLGARLVQRTTRKLSLTDVGRAYHQHARRIVDELHQAEQAVTKMQATPRGHFRITLPLHFDYLRSVVAGFLRDYPDVQIEMLCTDRVVDLVEEGFDLSIRAGPLADSTLIARRLGALRSHVVASPDFLSKHGEPQSPSDLQDLPGILFGAGASREGWRLESQSGSLRVKPRARLTVNDFGMVRDAALAGLGAALIPSDAIAEDVRSGRLRQLLCSWSSPPTPISALYPSTLYVSPTLRVFLEHLQAHFLALSDSF